MRSRAFFPRARVVVAISVILVALSAINEVGPAVAQTGTTDCYPPSYCRWYVAKIRTTLSKGGRAYVGTTPQMPPLLGRNTYGQSHSVTTSGALPFVQAGWRYYENYSSPRPFVEICSSTSCNQFEHGSINWNSSQQYQIYSPSGNSTWCGYLGTTQYECGLTSGGTSNQINWQSEVHLSHAIEVNTPFSGAEYKDAMTGLWTGLAPGFAKTELPYRGDADSGGSWNVKRGSTVSMALSANP
jgi:hypothetical protein